MRGYTSRKKHRIAFKAVIIIVVVLLLAAGALFGADKVLHAMYPMKYSDYVEHYSAKYGLDEYVVYAFIKTESSFDPSAQSEVGARGLMQIMPDTFEWIRYRLNEEDSGIDFDSMYNEKDNIRYGCYLLGYLNEEFDGGLTETAAAYHAGIGRVADWLLDSEYAKDGRLISIPSSDTAHYADKINNAYRMYCGLYSK